MNRRGGELFLGLTLTLATLIVVFGILFLGRSGLLSGGMTVQLRAAEAAGIGVGDEVLFRGVVTGSVRDIRFTEDAVLLELRLEGRPPIPRDSPFVIRSTGVLGGREIEIRPGASGELLRPATRCGVRSSPTCWPWPAGGWRRSGTGCSSPSSRRTPSCATCRRAAAAWGGS